MRHQRAESSLFVGAVVRRNGEILLVRQSAGHPLAGQWTIPWGRVEDGESPVAAAVRETREEGGIRAKVEGLIGAQVLPKPQEGGVGIVFLCAHVNGIPQPLDPETDAARYFSLEALDALTEPVEPWSNWLVRRIFAGRFHVTPADLTSPLLPEGAYL